VIYYIFPYLFIALMSLFSLKIKGDGYKLLFFVSLIPATLVVILRGLVGTDTETYISILDQSIFSIKENARGIEPFFLFFAKIRHYFDLNSQYVLNSFSFIIIFILYLFFSKNKQRSLIFCSLVFPIFFYDMTMNGLRYGMAFAFACWFIVDGSNSLKLNKSKIMYFISFLNHKSSLLFLSFKLLQKASLKNFLIILFTALIIFFALKSYLIYKIADYTDFVSPSIFSGSQPLIITFLILICNTYFFKSNSRRNLFLLLIQIFFYIITKFTYAGIRFQFLELFYIIVILCNDENILRYKKYIFLLFIIGFLGFLLRLNNFISTSGQGGSPFLPYEFLWEN